MTQLPAPIILHIDDDRDNRESTALLLAEEGFRVLEAATGGDALRLAREGPDVILLDVRLPDMDGFDVCRTLKEDPATAAIPVIQISGQFIRGEHRALGLEGGADAYLTKPVEPRELVAHIRALLRVRQAERAFRSLADNVPDIIARFDAELRHVYVNRRVEEATGLRAERFLGKSNRDLGMPADLVARWNQAMREVFATGRESSIEFDYTTPAGARLFETRLVPEFSPAGAVQTVLTVSRDITEQRRSKETLRRSEERFRRYFELGVVGMAITSPTKGILEVNDELCRLLGYDRPELLVKTWAEVTHPDDLAADVAQFERVMAGVIDGYTLDKRFVRKDGTVMETTISARCLRGPDGAVELFLGLVQDVTAQRRAERLLREREERYRLISELTSDYIYSAVRHPDGRFETEWVTGAFGRITGYTVEEVNGLGGWPALIHPDDRPGTGAFGAAIAANEPGVIEYRIITKDGTTHWLRDYARPQWDAGQQRVVRILGAVQDITERKRSEARLTVAHAELHALAAHLQSVREEERAFIAREIHDELGQALTGLKFDAAWLKGRVAKALPDAAAAPLVRRAEEMSAAIDATIQTVRRIAAELRPSVLDDFGLLAALEWQAEEFQRRTGIRCTVAGNPGDLDSGRATALFRIAQEALTNVARHAGASDVRIDVRREPRRVVLEVMDNGRGATPEDLHRPGSFGILGMRERAALAGGEVAFEGRPGLGARLEARIPIEPTGDAAPGERDVGGEADDPCVDRR